MARSRHSEDEAWIPWLWEGRVGALTCAESIGFVIGALVRALAEHPNGDDEDRFLVRGLISVDGPVRDRVWIDVERDGRASSLRAFAAQERDPARWCDELVYDYVDAFDVDAAEFVARCLPHYHGFLHSWTDEHAARAHYKTWPRRRQAAFYNEYLLYAANDARHPPHDDALREAAAWLLDRRRYVFRWTMTTLAGPVPRPAIADERALFDAYAALDAAIRASSPWLAPRLDEFARALEAPASTLLDVLARLGCDGGRVRLAGCHETLSALVSELGAIDPSAEPALQALKQALAEIGRWSW